MEKKVSGLVSTARKLNQTQIFIETPYRNQKMFDLLIKACPADTNLCVAMDITGMHESIQTKEVGKWRSQGINLPKLPTVFLLI